MNLREQLQASLGKTYTLEQELGGGGMSRVFVAEETSLGRKVVLKVLPPELSAGVNIERFRREIALAARLQHPHIVPLFSAGDAAGLPYFAMPLVEGESLRARLSRGELPVAEALWIIRDIAKALEYAHSHGVVHRDIKPDNVLISGHAATVTDFGVAKALSASTNPGGTLTDLGMALGTPAYMSPEQASADPNVDFRTDIYALGALAYEMLAGQSPFAGRTPQQMLAAQVTEAPVPLALQRASVPIPFADLIMRCLEKRPADRPQSAGEILTALEAVATPTGGMHPTRATPLVKRTRTMLRAGLAVAGALAAGVIVYLAQQGSKDSQSDLALDPNRAAVPPFANVTGDSTMGSVGVLAADWISQGLRQTDAVDVVSSASAQDFAGGQNSTSPNDARAVAAQTGAGTVVLGSYYKNGDSLRFQAQIIDANTGTITHTIEPVSALATAPMPAITIVRDRIMGAIASKEIAARVGLVGHTPSFPAYNLYVEAMGQWDAGRLVPAREMFRRATQLDSTFALAYLQLTLDFINRDMFREADSVLRSIERLKPRLTRSELDLMSAVESSVRGDLRAAAEAYRRLASRDRSFRAVANLALLEVSTNQPEAALKTLSTFRLEQWPFANAYTRTSEAHHMLGDFGESLKAARTGRTRYPENYPLLQLEVRGLAAMGDVDRLRQLLDSADQSWTSARSWTPANLAEMSTTELRAHGHSDKSDEFARRALTWLNGRPVEELETRAARRVAFGRALLLSGMPDSAAKVIAPAVDSLWSAPGFFLAVARSQQGVEGAVDPLLKESDLRWEEPFQNGFPQFTKAGLLAQVGRKDEAVRALRVAFQRGWYFTGALHHDPIFAGLQDYAPFKELIRPRR